MTRQNSVCHYLIDPSHTNFFSMGDNSKILFPTMGFSYPGKSKKIFLWSWVVPMGPLGLFGPFLGLKRLFFEQFGIKIEVF